MTHKGPAGPDLADAIIHLLDRLHELNESFELADLADSIRPLTSQISRELAELRAFAEWFAKTRDGVRMHPRMQVYASDGELVEIEAVGERAVEFKDGWGDKAINCFDDKAAMLAAKEGK